MQDPHRLIVQRAEELAELSDSGGSVVPYLGPSMRDKTEFLRAARLPQGVGLIGLRKRAHGFVALVSAIEKDGWWQRRVVDARAATAMHRRPPYALLPLPALLPPLTLVIFRTGVRQCRTVAGSIFQRIILALIPQDQRMFR